MDNYGSEYDKHGHKERGKHAEDDSIDWQFVDHRYGKSAVCIGLRLSKYDISANGRQLVVPNDVRVTEIHRFRSESIAKRNNVVHPNAAQRLPRASVYAMPRGTVLLFVKRDDSPKSVRNSVGSWNSGRK